MVDITSIKNGRGSVALPESREMVVTQAARYYQEVAQEIENLKRDLAAARSEIAVHKVVCEAQASQITELESRAVSSRVERDEAVANMVTYRTILIGFQSQLRTFSIEHAPLMRGTGEGE